MTRPAPGEFVWRQGRQPALRRFEHPVLLAAVRALEAAADHLDPQQIVIRRDVALEAAGLERPRCRPAPRPGRARRRAGVRCAASGRYCPLPGVLLRRSSRLTVKGLRPKKRRARSHPKPGIAQIREADPFVLRQEPRRDHLLPGADHGRIPQPRAATAGRCTTEPPQILR